MNEDTQRTFYFVLIMIAFLTIAHDLRRIETKIDWIQAQQDNVIETLIER